MVFEWCMALCTLSISYIYRLTEKKKGGDSDKRREREQLSKGKQFRDKQRDQYTYTQAIERKVE
jgi:hypothetical protein